jgi:ribosomal RNA assembly protein
MYQEELKIPKDRIPILIGKKGKDKRQLEKTTNTKITVNSKEGDVLVQGEDSFSIFKTKKIITAIARGFNPEVCYDLLSEGYALEIINIQDFVGKSKSRQQTIKSRLIGTKGKARKLIERLTHCEISVYGKTVAIIGTIENCYLAKRAMEMLLNGAPHGNVYKWLEKQKSHAL